MPEENQTMEEIHTVEEVDTTNESTPSQEEIQTKDEQKNTVATVGMRFSIIGLIAIISPTIGLVTHIERNQILLFLILMCSLAIFLILSPIFLVGFVLGIIGLFRKPRTKAWIAILIPLILGFVTCYVGYCIKTPAIEFYKWFQTNQETLNNSKFQYILQFEQDNTINKRSAGEIKGMFEASTGSNFLEKGAYLLSYMFQEEYENALEKFNNGELPEIIDEDEKLDIDIDTDDEDDSDKTEDSDINNEDSENIEQEEITIEEPKKEKSETFSQSEKNDIEQVLNFIE